MRGQLGDQIMVLDQEDLLPHRNKGLESSQRMSKRFLTKLSPSFSLCVGFCIKAGATPKGLLRVMGVQGLAIYHVKSHSQIVQLLLYKTCASSKPKFTIVVLSLYRAQVQSLQQKLEVHCQNIELLKVEEYQGEKVLSTAGAHAYNVTIIDEHYFRVLLDLLCRKYNRCE
ncbi:hypothetical protein Tco_1207496 [Tanacetum coccineum]